MLRPPALNASIGRDLAREHDALHGAAIKSQQEDPVVSPLQFRLRADLQEGYLRT
jgi:hypothetical protein